MLVDKIQVYRKALADTFNLKLVRNRMYGPYPWAELYNYLAEKHIEKS